MKKYQIEIYLIIKILIKLLDLLPVNLKAYKSKNIYKELDLEEYSSMKKFAILTQISLRCISTSDQYKIRKENN